MKKTGGRKSRDTLPLSVVEDSVQCIRNKAKKLKVKEKHINDASKERNLTRFSSIENKPGY